MMPLMAPLDVPCSLMPSPHLDLHSDVMALMDDQCSLMHTFRCSPSCSSGPRWNDLDVLDISP